MHWSLIRTFSFLVVFPSTALSLPAIAETRSYRQICTYVEIPTQECCSEGLKCFSSLASEYRPRTTTLWSLSLHFPAPEVGDEHDHNHENHATPYTLCKGLRGELERISKYQPVPFLYSSEASDCHVSLADTTLDVTEGEPWKSLFELQTSTMATTGINPRDMERAILDKIHIEVECLEDKGEVISSETGHEQTAADLAPWARKAWAWLKKKVTAMTKNKGKTEVDEESGLELQPLNRQCDDTTMSGVLGPADPDTGNMVWSLPGGST